jgi:hypothetical protein
VRLQLFRELPDIKAAFAEASASLAISGGIVMAITDVQGSNITHCASTPLSRREDGRDEPRDH